MTVLNAHFDGKQIVMDDPIPDGLPGNAKVRVIVESTEPSSVSAAIAKMAIDLPELPREYSVNHDEYIRKGTTEPQNALDKIAAMARPLGLPHDFSLNHKHYVKGTPKR